MLKKIPNLIIVATGIIGFQFISILERNLCYLQFNRKVSNCEFIRKLTFPGRFLYKGYRGINELINKKYQSVLIVPDLLQVKNRFDELKSGFSFYYPKLTRKNAGYILISRADPLNNGEPIIELWDLNKQEVLFKWIFDFDEFFKESGIKVNKIDLVFWHPLLLNDGSLSVIADNSTLVKFSPRGKLIKVNAEYKFHHTQEMDLQGKIYVPINNGKLSNQSNNRNPNHGINEGFAILDQELNVLKTYSMEEIYKNSGLEYKINYEAPSIDPFHINDVQPLHDDFETKIVLISLRHKSTVLAFDLDKEKIIWVLEGYAKYQHDVDFINNQANYISIFDNNTIYMEDGTAKSLGNIFTTVANLPDPTESKNSELIIFNYGSKSEKEKDLILNKEEFNSLDNKLIPKTAYEGLSEFIVENDSLFIEETSYGRLMEYNPKTKKILWQFINKNESNNLYYRMMWSRRMKSISPNILNYLKN